MSKKVYEKKARDPVDPIRKLKEVVNRERQEQAKRLQRFRQELEPDVIEATKTLQELGPLVAVARQLLVDISSVEWNRLWPRTNELVSKIQQLETQMNYAPQIGRAFEKLEKIKLQDIVTDFFYDYNLKVIRGELGATRGSPEAIDTTVLHIKSLLSKYAQRVTEPPTEKAIAPDKQENEEPGPPWDSRM